MRYRTRPAPIPDGELFAIDVEVRTAGGSAAAESLGLTADAAMPAHGHGMNTQPEVTRVAPGRYLVEGMLFHMPGHWEIYLDLREGGRAERAQVNIELE